MKLVNHFSLQSYNTFGIDVKAKQFISVKTEEELLKVLKQTYASELFVLGGGSNMLLTEDIQKTVLHLDIKGVEVVEENSKEVILKVSAGENWHDFVVFCIERDYGGLENLSLIPGNVGTSPIQNIGAYGVELKDVMLSCEAYHRQTLTKKIFSNKECKFGYRDSIFKKINNPYIITSVNFRLTKKKHQLNIDYGSIQAELKKMQITFPTIEDVSKAVIAIRQSKLPDPRKIGNSGSFFKNPIVPNAVLEKIQKEFDVVPFFKINEDSIKIPAGWLIEKTGLKGYRNGDAGVHKKQALVLVNYGQATGKEIKSVAELVQLKVKEKFDIQLETEVNIF